MKVIRIRYVRKHHKGVPVGCVVLLEDGRIGWSQCCPRDQFSKEKAKAIAIGRANAGYGRGTDRGMNKKPVLVKVLTEQWAMNGKWHYHTQRLDLMGRAIEEMYDYWDGRTNYHSEIE